MAKRKNTSSMMSMFGDAAPAGEPELTIVQASFQGSDELTFSDLITGYTRLRVLTYSNSLPIISRAAALLDEMEIIFGREDILNGMAQYVHYQELLLKELLSEAKQHSVVRQKIDAGTLRLYVVQESISHEKLFLLDGPSGTRVITGSANFSDSAFGGRQNESYICFDDDPVAWDYFETKYERIKERSAMGIAKQALLGDEIGIEDLPVFSAARPGTDTPKIVVVTDGPPAPTVVGKVLSGRTPKQYTGLSSSISPEKGAARIDRTTALRAMQYAKSNARTEESNPEEYLSIYPEKGLVELSGKPLDLDVPEDEVRSDVAIILEYWRGFEQFRGGDPQRLMRDYFTFMSWFYISPFICDFRNRAMAHDDYLMDYPVVGLLYGKSNCGKSELIRTLMLSMFGKEGFLQNDWLTKSTVPQLRQQNRRFPMVFDDLDRTRFDNHVNSLVKDDFITLKEYPAMVLSMNAEKDTFESEIRKRTLIIYTGASLPDHTGESRQLGAQIKKLKRQLGTALYREYLARVLDALEDEPPTDILHFSSSLLRTIFAEHSPGPLPDWCRVVSMDEYTQAKHDKVKTELAQLWEHKRAAWTLQGPTIILKVDDIHAARKLRKDIPDYLVRPGSQGDQIIFQRGDLEAFLEITLSDESHKTGFFQRLLGRD
jgi:hypothetical protein